MKMIELILISALVLVFLCSSASAVTHELTTFNNSLTTENMAFTTGDENITRYLKLKNSSIILAASLDLEAEAVGSSYTYEETANDSAYNSTGVVNNPTYAWDGDWTTYSESSSSSVKAWFFFNYTKIANAVYGTLWQVRPTDDQVNPDPYHNYTLPDACLDTNTRVAVYSAGGTGDSTKKTFMYCWNGSAWTHLGNSTGSNLYEEGMFWYIANASINITTNVTIDTGNNGVDYKNNTLWNGSVASDDDVDLNITAMNLFLNSSCAVDSNDYCYVPIIFYSATAGNLSYSNINTTYSLGFDFTSVSAWTGSGYSDQTYTKVFVIDNQDVNNYTSCNINATSPTLSDVLSVNDSNFTILESSQYAITAQFINPSAIDYSASNYYIWAECDSISTSLVEVDLIVTTRPTAGTDSSTGGGGTRETILRLNLTEFCGDGVCQEGVEDAANCWQDCRIDFDEMITCLFDDDKECPWGSAWFPMLLVLIVGGTLLYALFFKEVKYYRK